MKSLLDKLEALPSCDAEELQYMRKPGRVVFLSELRSIINEAKEESQEPFGYFKAEPFGWTDCAEADEGAVALYDQDAIDKLEAEREMLQKAIHSQKLLYDACEGALQNKIFDLEKDKSRLIEVLKESHQALAIVSDFEYDKGHLEEAEYWNVTDVKVSHLISEMEGKQ